MALPILRFDQLEVCYGRTVVLRQVSGEARTGEILLVSGPNGSGKSTLLRCLAGLQRPRRGTIAWPRGEQTGEPTGRGQVGWLGPDLALYPELTALENLVLFRTLRRLAPADDRPLLESLGLPPERRVGALSSGMLQRLRWLWALAGEPRILIFDEPFQNLDRPGVEALSTLLRERIDHAAVVIASPTPLDLPDVPVRTLELAR